MLTKILETALPVFAALFIGVLCRKRAIFSRADVDAMKKLAVDICLPAVVFSAFAGADYAPENLLIPVVMFLLCSAGLGLGYAFRALFHRSSRLLPFLTIGFESGMLGYGLFALLFPAEDPGTYAILELGHVLFVFTLYKGLLMGRGQGKELVRQAFTSPVMLGILGGVLFGVTGLYRALEPSGITGVISAVASFISAPTSFIILVSIGYDLSLRDTVWEKALRCIGIRYVTVGLVYGAAVLLNRTVLRSAIHEGALLLMVTLPAPYVLPVFANLEEERASVASTLSLMTLFSLILFAVLAAVL